MQAFTISPLGEGVLVVSFGNVIDDDIHNKVLRLFQHLKNFAPFISDVVPAYSSLAVYYDVLSLHTTEKPAYERMKELLLPVINATTNTTVSAGRVIVIPVCYVEEFALDLKTLAAQKALSVEDVIRLHTAKTYRVYMIGFLPGFPYMGKVDERLATPRRSNPRTTIAAGSVGIAGEQTGIYPLDSPGGWNIIGRTPLKLF